VTADGQRVIRNRIAALLFDNFLRQDSAAVFAQHSGFPILRLESCNSKFRNCSTVGQKSFFVYAPRRLFDHLRSSFVEVTFFPSSFVPRQSALAIAATFFVIFFVIFRQRPGSPYFGSQRFSKVPSPLQRLFEATRGTTVAIISDLGRKILISRNVRAMSARVFSFAPTSKSFKGAVDHPSVRPFVATPLRHVCAREKRQLPNITRGPLAKGVWKFWTFLVARVGPRYRVARPLFSESPHRHARTHARTRARTTHARGIDHPALSFFSRPRDISGRALVTGYPPTSREANF